jgi:D-sedoheptulose 7-phosphate isomerase
MLNLVREQLGNSLSVMQKVMGDESLILALSEAGAAAARAMLDGHKLMVAGNGGSAADAQHLVAEFVCRLTIDRPAMRAIALTTDSSILTAVGNDFGYEHIFERQIEALGQPGDVFLGISTSGQSPNILRALEFCQKSRITTVGFSGKDGGKMAPLCDYNVIVPSAVTQHIQECQLVLEHIFCMIVERCYFGPEIFEPQLAKSKP